MEREVSLVIEIGVALIAISAVIGIIWFTVFLGRDVAADATEEASSILVANQVGVLEDLKDKENVMPASAAYSILRTYSNYIPESYCNYNVSSPIVRDLVTTPSCLLEHLIGKVSLEVTDSNLGGYRVVIHHMNCDWINKNYTVSSGIKCRGCEEQGW